MEECEKFRAFPNKYSICIGESNISKWKIDTYRIRWGLEPLFNVERPEPSQEQLKQIGSTRSITPNQAREGERDEMGEGPGTELIKIYKAAGVPACSQCYALAKQMNLWGPDKCLERLEFLVDDILPRAKSWVEQNRPWIHKLLPNAIEDTAIKFKIRMDLKEAIDRASNIVVQPTLESKPEQQKTAPPKRKGCGCSKR